MEMYKSMLAEHLSTLIEELTKEELQEMLAYPQYASMGDLSLPCFKLSKLYRRAPQQIAEQLVEQLDLDIIERAEAVSGYVNLFLNKAKLAEQIVGLVLAE